MSVGFVLPALDRPSGGNTFNARVVEYWPGEPPAVEIAGSAAELSTVLRRHPVTVVDGLLATAAPDAVRAAVSAGHRVVLLLHMTVGANESFGSERAAVAAASAVVVPSRHTARIVAERHGRTDVVVATPGVEPAPRAETHDPPTLLQVGAIGTLKNQRMVLEAVARVRPAAPELHLVGPVVDPAYAADLARLAQGTPGVRVRIDGPLTGVALAEAFAGADLLVSVARNEAYGLVVTEALARGIPAVVGRGTGAAEALRAGGGRPGLEVATDDPHELAGVLQRWTGDSTLRRQWREQAVQARGRLPPWSRTAGVIAELCRALSRG